MFSEMNLSNLEGVSAKICAIPFRHVKQTHAKIITNWIREFTLYAAIKTAILFVHKRS